MVENFDKFDKWQTICQSFPYYLNVSFMKPTINLSKFCSSKYCVDLICPSFILSNFCAIQGKSVDSYVEWINTDVSAKTGTEQKL